MLTATRRKQLATFTVVMYILTISAIINSYNASRTFLQMSLKLSSGVNLLILMVFGLLNLALIWNVITWILFGELRLIEQEHIFERVPFSVLGIIIMTSMFSEYHLMTLISLSGGLIALKIYHWILKDRLEQRLQAINNETKFRNLIFSQYIRNLIIFCVVEFWVAHYFWTKYIFRNDLTDDDVQIINIGYGIGNFQAKIKGNYDSYMSVFLLFGMEFCVLFVDHLELASHTILNYYEFYLNDRRQQRRHHNHIRIPTEILSDTDESDIQSDEEINDNDDDDEDSPDDGLENKFIYEKIIDIVSRVAKTALHVLILCRLQIVVIKDIIWDLMSLYKGITSLWKIYKNNRQLDDKLPNIDIIDLMDHDNICIVCMDDLVSIPSDKILKHENDNDKEKKLLTQLDIDNIKKFKRPKKLPCGHMLHLSCLKNWMERSQTCPICRLAVFDENGKVKPSIVPLRPRSNNTNTNETVSPADITTEGPSSGISTNTDIEINIGSSPIDINDTQHESWYTFDIKDINKDANGLGETINFTAETIPHMIGTSSGGNQLPLSLRIKPRDRDANGAVIVKDSQITFPHSNSEK
ncbi:similar to Saccharomyces cerevisiae YOL013C HRD1 Ubiquitin-protein ligase required for endoplasmic reticulum-associated degradation (ERAD) of misfolded proteins [Maudiozyma saulgeensis]|uniref:RING-type E3 ubiquitin transferase n=1 Tax=Maudiozyma saulgeensis TaxID=1789683 RepID=A0A1X7QZR9_9SACH|nr:similar to Saccharomyces cerevisiae YOL013C HRD1 Ubiquitin-protein ligase required for endoplasmic reticulum-associated degradation (ERAD) of misfolded proteins [Kazachstania saulgeensis]